MPITLEATASSSVGTGTTHTVAINPQGSDRVLIVFVSMGNSFNNNPDFTAATFNSENLTLLSRFINGGSTMGIFYLLNPPTGSANISITRTSPFGSTRMHIGSFALSGAEQSAPDFEDYALDSDETSLATINASAGDFIGAGSIQASNNSNAEVGINSGFTQSWNVTDSSFRAKGSRKVGSSGGSERPFTDSTFFSFDTCFGIVAVSEAGGIPPLNLTETIDLSDSRSFLKEFYRSFSEKIRLPDLIGLGRFTQLLETIHVSSEVAAQINNPPTIILSDPANEEVVETPSPALEFIGTDPEGDDITYQVQVDDADDSFNSLVVNVVSDTDSGFANTDTPADSDPFNSGEKVGYTVAVANDDLESPSTAVDDDAVGTRTWSNVNSIFTSNNDRALVQFSIDATSHFLKATNFGFNIPTGATIVGIKVDIEKNYSGSTGVIQDSEVKIVKSDGSIGTTNRAIAGNWPTSDTYIAHGSPSDLWGETWSASDINNANFGVAISCLKPETTGHNTNAQIDHVRITVYYTTGLDNGTYYWRVRGLDPTGSNTWGDWSDIREFTIASGTAYLSDLTESVIAVDSVSRSTIRSLLEPIIISDSVVRSVARLLAESIRVVDTRLTGFYFQIVESVIIADTVVILRNLLASLTDSVTLASTRVLTSSRALLDTIVTTDKRTRASARSLFDTVIASDAVVVVRSILAQFTDSLILSDTRSFSIGKILQDTLTTTDRIARAVTHSLTDTLIMADQFRSGAQRLFTDSLRITDVSLLQTVYVRLLTETIRLTDVIKRSIDRVFTETTRLSDAISSGRFMQLLETVRINDVVSRVIAKILLETVRVSDATKRSASTLFTETTKITDSLFVILGFDVFLTESIRIKDSLFRVIERSLRDTLQLSDSLLASVQLFFTETIRLTDQVAALLAFIKQLSDSIRTSDQLVRSAARALYEKIILSDIVDRIIVLFAVFSETIQLGLRFVREFPEGITARMLGVKKIVGKVFWHPRR